MKNLTDLFEGLLDQDFDISGDDAAVSIISSMLEAKAGYMEIYNKFMFDLDLPTCRVSETPGKSANHTIVLLQRKNSVFTKIRIFTRLNSKCWSGLEITGMDGRTKYTKTTQSIYKPPTNSRDWVARLLPKEASEEFRKFAS